MVEVQIPRLWKFNLEDGRQILTVAVRVFKASFKPNSNNDGDSVDQTSGSGDDSNSNSDYCPEISEPLEEFVESNVDDCKPLKKIFGEFVGGAMEDNLKKPPREASECTAIRFVGRDWAGKKFKGYLCRRGFLVLL